MNVNLELELQIGDNVQRSVVGIVARSLGVSKVAGVLLTELTLRSTVDGKVIMDTDTRKKITSTLNMSSQNLSNYLKVLKDNQLIQELDENTYQLDTCVPWGLIQGEVTFTVKFIR